MLTFIENIAINKKLFSSRCSIACFICKIIVEIVVILYIYVKCSFCIACTGNACIVCYRLIASCFSDNITINAWFSELNVAEIKSKCLFSILFVA